MLERNEIVHDSAGSDALAQVRRRYAVSMADQPLRAGTAEHILRFAGALAGSTTLDELASAVASYGGTAAGATFANMAIFETRTNRVRVVHHSMLDVEIAARWTDFSIGEPTPLCDAILSGGAVLLGSLDVIGLRYPNLVDDTVAASLRATASLPLRTASGATLGAVGFGWEEDQVFDPDQLRWLELIADVAARALTRTIGSAHERDEAWARQEDGARMLQEAFLPLTLPHTDHLDMAAAYLPASDAMGGDWYDVFPVDGGTCIVIGDVAGHGLRCVAVMAQLRSAARVFADEDPSPASIMTRLNRMLCRLEPDETATAMVAVWDDETKTLVRANAGHPPLLRCRRGEFSFLAPTAGGVMLGADPAYQYGQIAKVLRPGTTLVFYTDGLVETRRENIDDSMEQLRLFVEGLSDLSSQRLCNDILSWRLGRGCRDDDLCILAARLA